METLIILDGKIENTVASKIQTHSFEVYIDLSKQQIQSKHLYHNSKINLKF